MQELEKSKPVILTGDLNCAHEEIDIYNPAVSDSDFDVAYESLFIPYCYYSLGTTRNPRIRSLHWHL